MQNSSPDLFANCMMYEMQENVFRSGDRNLYWLSLLFGLEPESLPSSHFFTMGKSQWVLSKRMIQWQNIRDSIVRGFKRCHSHWIVPYLIEGSRS